MHPAALRGFWDCLKTVPGAIPGNPSQAVRHVLDMGGQDVNGTVHNQVRDLMGQNVVIDVLDIEAGAGVTVVGDATDLSRPWWEVPLGRRKYDLVISTEMLEHVRDWEQAIMNAYAVLRPGGWFVGTCASIGRGAHGATGAPDPAPGEWYDNVDPGDLADVLHGEFDAVRMIYSVEPTEWTTHDLYWAARKAENAGNEEGAQ